MHWGTNTLCCRDVLVLTVDANLRVWQRIALARSADAIHCREHSAIELSGRIPMIHLVFSPRSHALDRYDDYHQVELAQISDDNHQRKASLRLSRSRLVHRS